MEQRNWPYEISKPEGDWSELDRQYVAFMKTAWAEGFRPREYGSQAFIALGTQPQKRSIDLVFRGVRNGWEPILGDGERTIRLGPFYDLPLGENACVCIRPPFTAAAFFALEWMRGRSPDSLLTEFEFVGGYPSGIAWRGKMVSPPPLPATMV